MKRYYRKNLSSLVNFAVSNILAAVSSVFLSFLLGSFADIALTGDFERVKRLAVGTLIYILVETFFNYLLQYTRDAAVHKIGKDLRSDVVCKIEKLPYEMKKENDDGYYMSVINNDVVTIEEEYLDSLGAIFFQVCCFSIAVAASLAIQPVMTAIMLAVSIMSVAFPKLTEKPLQKAKEEEQQAKSSYLSVITQILNGFFLLKIFDGFGGMNSRHEKENENLRKKKTKFSQMSAMLYAGAYGCGNIVFLGTWVLGLFFVTKKLITLPLLITFSQLMTFVAGPIQITSERYSLAVAASAVCKRVLGFLDEYTDEELRWGGEALNSVDEVEIKDLCYRAGEKTLLKNVALVLRKGDRVALLGESGSGKSTLMKVLSAVYDGEGEYKINGKPCRFYAYGDFRKRVTLLEQKSFVFDASIRENVTMFSDENATDEAVLSELKEAGLTKWYESRGASLDAVIGSSAKSLSGGEERRLDLARTLHRGAGFVMLDEPTTGLDPESRLAAEKTIENLESDILLVAMHEYSPEFLEHFNRVIEVKNGEIYER